MTGVPERSPWGTAASLESGRAPTEEHVSHVIFPNGSVADVVGIELSIAVARYATEVWTEYVRRPRCERAECGEAIEYQRAAHAAGGDSTWVHTATGSPTCADGRGRCARPTNWNPDTARRAS